MKDFNEIMQNGGYLPIGVDDGFDETKIALPNGEFIRIPSQAKSGKLEIITIDDGAVNVFSYTTSEGVFVTGNILDHDSTASDFYPISAMNRVIVSHALKVAKLNSSHNLFITTGLPLKKYYKSNAPNKELILAKTKNLLTNDVVANFDYNLPVIKQHKILAEGLASWFDYTTIRSHDGSLERSVERYGMRIAIIDIGGRTTDIAVIKKGQLEYGRSSTIEVGMLDVKESIKQSVFDEYDGVELTNEQMYHAIEDGKIKLWGEWEDISHITKEAEKTVASRIKSEATRRLKTASDIDTVLFVGGTVNRISDLLTGWFKNQKIAENPEFCNARGMQKFSELMLLSEK
jgi:plasmid segregation protein ParM